MSLKSERNFWRVSGSLVLVLGFVVMIAALVMLYNDDDVLNKMPSRIQALGCAIALCGVCALVLSRVLSLLNNPEREPNVILTAICYGSMTLGILAGLVQVVMWRNAVSAGLQEEGFTPWQKSGFVAVGFLIMAGVISLIGERTARLYVKHKALRSGSANAGR